MCLLNWISWQFTPSSRFNEYARLFRGRLGFSYFEFKIKLIRLDLSFQKQKFPVFEFITDLILVRSHTHCIKEPTVSGRHRKALSNLQSYLTDSSWIHLILLIKLIQYKTGKTHWWLLAQLFGTVNQTVDITSEI